MYTKTLIEDLVARVERAEATVRVQAEQPNAKTWFAMAPAEPSAPEAPAQLLGVA